MVLVALVVVTEEVLLLDAVVAAWVNTCRSSLLPRGVTPSRILRVTSTLFKVGTGHNVSPHLHILSIASTATDGRRAPSGTTTAALRQG